MLNERVVNEENKKFLIEKYLQYLASVYSLYLKTQNFHWNITGSEFISLHQWFQEQYEALAEALDIIAERIRAFEIFTPGSFSEYIKLSKIKDAVGDRNAQEMITELLENHLLIVALTKELIYLAKDCNDEVSQDLLVNRLKFHEKTIWILRSFN